MNAELFKPANLLIIFVIAILAQFAFSGVKRYLSSKSTDAGA